MEKTFIELKLIYRTSGVVDCSAGEVIADAIPEDRVEENPLSDVVYRYFNTYEEAKTYLKIHLPHHTLLLP